ncbi:leukocyte surface antigen CD53-like [Siniperca chuatsi]|uniref:leukocyte surface antigen CD53-like n=1 Tax=Siniperca chuatsi TaxID=119488 RepID=UPI001CE1B378|nr:leukocyte surface antigen CD53-like [Siniperca chuatsi]
MKRCTVHSTIRRGSVSNTKHKSENRDKQIVLPNRSDQRCYRMAQGCLKFLKYTMCAANFLCFICGVAVLGFGVYMMVNFKMAALTPNLAKFNVANMLLISGIVITCVSFLGFLGALKENRCLLLTFFLLLFLLMLVELTAACFLLMYESKIGELVTEDLNKGLKNARDNRVNSTNVVNEWDLLQRNLDCCGVDNVTDWGMKIPDSCCPDGCNSKKYRLKGCLITLQNFFEDNFLNTGVSVIALCIIEVLGMCFAMTLYCHISSSGLGYKL